jgi:ribosome-binding protein aMBF1 (putative translation factor)
MRAFGAEAENDSHRHAHRGHTKARQPTRGDRQPTRWAPPAARGVRGHRLALGLSQHQLAWRTGVNQSTISRLETGRIRSMRIRTLARIVGVLDLDPDFLFRGEPRAPSRRLPGMLTLKPAGSADVNNPRMTR